MDLLQWVKSHHCLHSFWASLRFSLSGLPLTLGFSWKHWNAIEPSAEVCIPWCVLPKVKTKPLELCLPTVEGQKVRSATWKLKNILGKLSSVFCRSMNQYFWVVQEEFLRSFNTEEFVTVCVPCAPLLLCMLALFIYHALNHKWLRLMHFNLVWLSWWSNVIPD